MCFNNYYAIISYVLIIDCQKIAEVYRRKLALDKYTPTVTAVTLFYSRIILKKFKKKITFKKLEKSVNFSVKCVADIKLNSLNNNQGIIEIILYERRVYESVDNRSLS